MNDFRAALFGGVIAALAGVAAQFFIGYCLIEKPKLELERKRIAIEVEKQILSFTPSISPIITNKKIDEWSWQVDCRFKNNGQYPTQVTIEKTPISLFIDQADKEFETNSICTIIYVNDRKSTLVSPNDAGDLRLYVKFSKDKFPKGLGKIDQAVIIHCSEAILEDAQKHLVENFPEAKNLINRVSKYTLTIKAPLDY